MNLIYPYQYIKVLSPNLIRIGIHELLQYKLKKDYEYDRNFIFKMDKIQKKVSAEGIVANLYNQELITAYLFFTPYDGIIVNKNYKLINNPRLILKNNETDNWLFDIKTNFNYKHNTYD